MHEVHIQVGMPLWVIRKNQVSNEIIGRGKRGPEDQSKWCDWDIFAVDPQGSPVGRQVQQNEGAEHWREPANGDVFAVLKCTPQAAEHFRNAESKQQPKQGECELKCGHAAPGTNLPACQTVRNGSKTDV